MAHVPQLQSGWRPWRHVGQTLRAPSPYKQTFKFIGVSYASITNNKLTRARSCFILRLLTHTYSYGIYSFNDISPMPSPQMLPPH